MSDVLVFTTKYSKEDPIAYADIVLFTKTNKSCYTSNDFFVKLAPFKYQTDVCYT